MDLSRVPEPLRSRIAEQLAQLPPEVRATLEKQLAKVPSGQLDAVLKKMGPTLERLAGKQAGGKPPPRSSTSSGPTVAGSHPPEFRKYDPNDHYNNTVRRGDASTPPLLVILFLTACAVVFLRTLGFFS